jgi:TM2 domain-containing membrane protein YozV
MKWIILLALLITCRNFSQSGSINFNSPENIKKFADHLFCEKDYLRANLEYERLDFINSDDSLLFKIGIGYSFIQDYQNANLYFDKIAPTSNLYEDSELQRLKLFFLLEAYESLNSIYRESISKNKHKYLSEASKLEHFSYFFSELPLPLKEKFLTPFSYDEKQEVSFFYDMKSDMPYKSSLKSALMSAVIPGAGKIYTGNTGDGITSFLTTSLLAFLAYDNFKANHNIRGWIFAGLGSFFYAGNIYGSIAAVQIFNARLDFEFKEGIKVYLQNNNYFTPEYDFCD